MHTFLRRTARGAALFAAAVTVSTALAAPASAAPVPLLPEPPGPAGTTADRKPADRLTVTVSGSGRTADGVTRSLECRPVGGDHPHATEACDELNTRTRWGRDPFAPVATGRACTQIYGGPAVAHVEGRWAGRPVSADFSRANGCEAARWDQLGRLLDLS